VGTLIILALIFIIVPLVFMFVTRDRRDRADVTTPEGSPNPEVLRRPLRTRHPRS
jgi:hypothetical protein